MRLIKPDLVLLHAPSVYDFRELSVMHGPIADAIPPTSIFEMYPIGFSSIVGHLENNGINVRIINLAIRMLNSEKFDAEKMIRRLKPKAFGIDLHWLPHAHGSLEVAKLCKKHHPDIPIIFGGYSATYFHDELIRRPEVDFVVRGDSAEEPLRQLMMAIVHSSSFNEIPNLVWKDKNGSIKINPLTNVLSDMNGFSNNYVTLFKSALKYLDARSLTPIHDWWEYAITSVMTCRGCVHNCVICGGSKKALKTYCNRSQPAFRDAKLIIDDIAKLKKYTNAPIFVVGDLRQPSAEYADIVLDGLRKEGIKNQMVLELFNTAPKEYFEKVAASIENFNFEISPESHDERVRKFCGKPYSNDDMEKNIRWVLELGCEKFDVFFMIGLPQQTYQSVMETVDYCQHLLETYGKRVVPFIFPLAPFLDPGSIAYENPEKFGYRILFKTLEEHRQAISSPSWKYALNYETEWMSRDEIVDSTYQAGLRLNKVKAKCGLIDENSFRETERKIQLAIDIIKKIDRIQEIDDSETKREKLMQLKSQIDITNNSTINEKRNLKWPSIRKRNLKLLNIARAVITE
ncbi:MAG: TIGR04190 family B12-binding domain/radical SAM domain protein [Deltaproteobacteria bacterium]|nr:TIGR04190 family B12-binding domain/radical SAM domain protein [Deltaproteobacteria bacterium]